MPEGITNRPQQSYIERVKEMEARMVAEGLKLGGLSGEEIVRNQIRHELEGHQVTGLEIARRNARIMRQDMARYKKDSSNFTRSLGAATGFMAQQYMIGAKKIVGRLDGIYVYGSGWQWAAMSAPESPQPDVSGHSKITVPTQIAEIYHFLHQADENELLSIYKAIDKARADKAGADELNKLYAKVDNFDSHIRPIIGDIDAGYGDPAATKMLAKMMIQAGACCIQFENQVSDLKQCGHQDGKVSCTREEYLAKIQAIRQAFWELGVEEGVIVARTDSLGAGLTKEIPQEDSPYAEDYIKYLDMKPYDPNDPKQRKKNQIILDRGEEGLMKPVRLENGLFKFKPGSGFARAVDDAVFAQKVGGADLIWIETEKPSLKQITDLADAIRKEVPDTMITYNNSPSFPWTLNARQLVLKRWKEAADERYKDYPDPNEAKNFKVLASEKYDNTDLGREAAEYIRSFQEKVAKDAGVFHNLITLPEFHVEGLGGQRLAGEYFSGKGMQAYINQVQDPELRGGYSSAAHQRMSGSDLKDYDKQQAWGNKGAVGVAAGEQNTQNAISEILSGAANKDEPAIPEAEKKKAVGQ